MEGIHVVLFGVLLVFAVADGEEKQGNFCKRPPSYADGPQYPVGYPVKRKYAPGNLMYFRCLDGYELIGNRIRVCDESGLWSSEDPWCNRTSCPRSKIYKPENGRYTVKSFRIGSVINYECNPGYYLVGSKQLVCRSNGTWSARNPYCVSKCRQTKCQEGMKCILNPKTAMPVCICKQTYDCPFNFSPMCGSDGKTYANRCLMGMIACNTSRRIEPIKNGTCDKGDTFAQEECTACPKIKICSALYASGYAFLGKPEKAKAEDKRYIITFRIIETYKGGILAGKSLKVYMKKRQRTCSCIPRLPNAKVLVMGQYGRVGKEYFPVIDENTFLTKFYSHKQLNLCWLYK